MIFKQEKIQSRNGAKTLACGGQTREKSGHVVRKHVKVYPCKTRKIKDRLRPKNCYREYFLPGSNGNDVKVCKNIFMSSVKCSSDFIDKTLCEVTKAVTYSLEDVVTTSDHKRHRNRIKIHEIAGINPASYIHQEEQGLRNIPLVVEVINHEEVSPQETNDKDVMTKKVAEESSKEDTESFDLLEGHENILEVMEEINEDKAFEAVNYLERQGQGHFKSCDSIKRNDYSHAASQSLPGSVHMSLFMLLTMCLSVLNLRAETLIYFMCVIVLLCLAFLFLRFVWQVVFRFVNIYKKFMNQ